MDGTSLIQSLYKAFKEQADCDITFIVKDEDIKAHKFMISLRSEVLKTMLNNKLSYENDKIVIKDPEVEAEDFRQFLQYLYTDNCEISESIVKVLLHLGHMYVVPSLLESCTSYIQMSLQNDNIFAYAELGLLYGDDCKLMKNCLEYLSENDVLVRKNVLYDAKASLELVKKIVGECERTNSVTEDHLFKAIFKWAQFECVQRALDKNASNLKAVITDILPLIKFDKLKSITLATTISDNKLLPETEIFQYLRKAVITESNAEFGTEFFFGNKRKHNNNNRKPWQYNRDNDDQIYSPQGPRGASAQILRFPGPRRNAAVWEDLSSHEPAHGDYWR
uniref:BTB domain-containing protein n=1 Tax=Panagrolaimus sp. ES5 TaxID=591445 RepID=A0AC34FDK8_9BILA